MTFIVTLVALLIERFFVWSHLRHWRWYMKYQNMIAHRFPSKLPFLTLFVTVVPIIIIVALINYFLDGVLYGVANFLFNLFVFLYCLGPQNLWADAFASINALKQGDAQFASDKLETAFGMTGNSQAQSLHEKLLNHIFVESNRRVFAIVFWFGIIGPIGAFLYRMIAVSASASPKLDVNPELGNSARQVEGILDWIPVRIFSFIFALGGHFTKVLSCWRKKVLQGINSNESLITECGEAAISHDEQGKLPQDGSAEKSAIHLLDRALLIVLVVIAIVTFA